MKRQDHFHSMHQFLIRRNSSASFTSLERAMLRGHNAEVQHWRDVLTRLLSCIKYLAEHDIAIRGTGGHEYLGDQKNGSFLSLVELVAIYDVVLAEHLNRIKLRKNSDHYLGKNIQNEFIQLLGDKVLEEIISQIKQDRYYAIILDCTPDANHDEQMTMVIRHVHITNDFDVVIHEHFTGFIVVKNSTSSALTKLLLQRLTEMGLDIQNSKGQGYDNGANMAGKKNGVQKRVLELNAQARFVPCSCHSLNLVLSDCAKSNHVYISFFGALQKLYAKLSASISQWQILKKECPLVVKYPSTTRWESKINSVKVVHLNLVGIIKTLHKILETVCDPKDCSDIEGLLHQLTSFESLVTCCIWHKVLSQVNFVSKSLQASKMNINQAIILLEGCLNTLKQFRLFGFNDVIAEAQEIAKEVNSQLSFITIPLDFKQQRIQIHRRMADETGNDSVTYTPQKKYEVECFSTMVDKFISSISNRFEQLKQYKLECGLLLNINQLTDDNLKGAEGELMKLKCMKLSSDLENAVDGPDLCNELLCFINLPNKNASSEIDLLKYIAKNGLVDTFPNLFTSLKILLTIPVSVASAERTFSKLKLIKTFLRSKMSENRLNGLALMSIEREISNDIDFNDVINKFALQKARKQTFM